ncbi:MAG: heme o synthase [Candidatus Limnocylindrales bacterium]
MDLRLTGLQKLALASVIATWIMVVIGVIVRSTGSGMGCPDWPLCYGQVIPQLGDTAAWLESIHRWWGVVIGFLVLGLVVSAFRTQRATRSVVVGSVVALGIVGFQAYLGKITVDTNNSAETVLAHLATAMVLLGVFLFVLIRSRFPGVLPTHGASLRIPLLVGFAAISVFTVLLFGAETTCPGVDRGASGCAALIFPDWPLFGGQLIPAFSDDPTIANLQMRQFSHRIVAAIAGIIVLVTTLAVWRAVRRKDIDGEVPGAETMLGLVGTGAALYAVQIVVGALQIWTTLEPWAVSLHLSLGSLIWVLLLAGALHGWYSARAAVGRAAGAAGIREPLPAPAQGAPAQEAGATVEEGGLRVSHASDRGTRLRAYVALTKPRIIELLLVTTVPAMVLAWRFSEGLDAARFAWLVVATLVGGSLAAGAANAINNYLDRDIDLVMVRTQRRPLPAHAIAPEDALMFGLALTVISFAWLAFTTNLVAAFLTLLAVAFYVVVYTMVLKRTTPQNIVIGGAAGALPPLIGWAAVTGDISLPALFLFAIVFYWTPPHFWALALRIRGDYAAANVPMLPVTHGVRETTHQIALYTALMVALTLVFFAVAEMGLLFLAGALVLGGLFLFQALAMAREGTDARAVRIYKYSITYLTALFALIILDVAVFIPL